MRIIDVDRYRKDLLSVYDDILSTYDDVSMEFEVLERQPLVDAIPIPEGATNGDMIKAMFPNARTWEVTRDNIRCACVEFDDICEIKTFPLSWWDAPYKAESEDV